MPRLLGAPLRPEECKQLVATDRAMSMRGENREQGQAPALCYTPDGLRPSGSVIDRQPAERSQAQHVEPRMIESDSGVIRIPIIRPGRKVASETLVSEPIPYATTPTSHRPEESHEMARQCSCGARDD